MKKNVSKKAIEELTTEMRERFAKAYALALSYLVSLVLHVTKHSGKLEGIQSVSTLSVCNPYCLARMADGDSVCSHCYVQGHKYKTALMAHLIANFKRLNSGILPDYALPFITSVYGRIESFGDVATVTQAINYIHLIRKNPAVRFAIWTKNHNIWAQAFAIEGKPENCTFVLSSDKLNVVADIPESVKAYVDYVFTVFSFAYVKKHNISINCGLRRCMECGHCYNRGNPVYVNEILKKDARKYTAWKNQ